MMVLFALLFGLITTISGVTLLKSPDDVRIPGSYIIKFKDTVTEESIFNYFQYATNSNITTTQFDIGGTFRGVFVHLHPRELLKHLIMDEVFEYIEEDMVVSLSQSCNVQTSATWGISRVSRKARTGSGFPHPSNGGQGVTSYIIDTGIRTSHTEFAGGRASWGTNTVDSTNSDCNGHGTHVAGTVAGQLYGVAKQAKVVAVKVLNCAGSGSNAGVIAGMDWVAKNHKKPANANLSLGGTKSTSTNNAVTALVNAGVVTIVAAGNDNANACNYSPASAPEAITVGATTNADARASYSNIGTCLDLFAPGSSITSAWWTTDTATNTISGTSMASPHVAGLVSVIQSQNPSASVSAITKILLDATTANILTSIGTGSPNKLGYIGTPCGV